MKKFLGFCLIVGTLVSCFDEQRVDPARPSTFVRYINGGYPDSARALEKTPDGGFVILANTFPTAPAVSKIKLIKTDAFGTVLWSRIIPEFAEAGVKSYHANGISVFAEGYIITGETINNSDGKSTMLIVKTDADGHPNTLATINLPTAGTSDVRGQAAQWVDATKMFVLGSIVGAEKNIVVAELNLAASPPTVTWDHVYGSNSFKLINKLFLDSSSLTYPDSTELTFGGTMNQVAGNNTDLRFIRTIQNAGAVSDVPIGDPDVSERANGMCKTINGYAMIGSSNTTGTSKTDRDILFTKLNASGNILSRSTFPVYDPKSAIDVGLDDEGNAICSTKDHGFIVLGTIKSSTVEGRTIGRGETDYYLMKINNFGELEWNTSFGSKKIDIGVSVVQAEDGGFVVLGTTVLANVPTLALIKTSSKGEIE